MDLVVEIYSVTDNFPKSELYGLTSQMKRLAVSIPSNIAEGRRRGGKKDYANFVRIAYGSGAELETQIEIVKKLNFNNINFVKAEGLLNEIMKMLNKMLVLLQATS